MKSPDPPPKGELDTFSIRSGAKGTQLFNHDVVSNWGISSPDPPGGGIQSSRCDSIHYIVMYRRAAPKEAIKLGSLATRSGTRGTQLHHPIFFN